MNAYHVARALLLSTALLAYAVPVAAADEAHSGQHSMQMTGDQDHDFATMMRKHHSDGVIMAEKQLKDGRDPEMKAMAQKIVTAQNKEIEELDKWLANHKRGADGEKNN